MNKSITTFIGCLLLAAGVAFAQTEAETAKLKSEIETDLTESILPFWINHSVDPEGGFYGTIQDDGTAVPGAAKGAVLNARILWTFSKAYRHYGLEKYKELADRAAEYYINHFIDKKFGGVYWTLTSEGYPKQDYKQTYAAAFGIYGLSEHFRATGDERSLEAALSIYRTLEEKVHDKAGKGYIEVFRRDYTRGADKGVDGRKATKTMNTHIHVMEAFTTLYQVWPDPQLRQDLYELVEILQTKLYNSETKHLIQYADDKWNPIPSEDSYGHDIETSWLLCETAEALGDEKLIASIRKQAIEMVDVAIAEGIEANGVWKIDESYKTKEKAHEWWPENEAVIGLINAWQITGQKKYFDEAVKNWEISKKYFIDTKNGGWFKALKEDLSPAGTPKASEWNCPYHNSRMGYEIRTRLELPRVHSEVMAWSNITGIRMEGELIDFESTLRVGVPGGKMESTGREKQNRIRYERKGYDQVTITPMHGATITQTVSDVNTDTVNLKWSAEATETLKEGLYFCMSFAPKYYSSAVIKTSGKKVTVTAPERNITLSFNKSVKTAVREEDGEKVLYVTLMPTLTKGRKAELSAVMKTGGIPHHETAKIAVKADEPGRLFAGFGGNFRIQNVQKDPEVIDYCLKNLRVAFGRVEMPWAQWDKDGAAADHIKRSAEMARKLKEQGMPVIVSCWFPPQWAGNQTTRSDGTSRAYSLKPEEKGRIFESLASYLLFLKKDYGVEADYFSFNESDLGINVVFTPEEHRDFIKEFGAYMASKNLKTLMLLGDNSDATTFDFIVPALNDPAAHKYIGAVSFHSWRGCDDATLAKWAAASRQLNVPLLVAEGSTDAAAHQYAGIFNETTFALYEINLYTRICAISQPLSILQWQLTSDYSLLWGDGIYGSDGPLRPTQRFFNIKQLSMTPENAHAVPAKCDKDNVNVASFVKASTGESAVHIVNNAASCTAEISGLPASTTKAVVYITNAEQNAEAHMYEVKDGKLSVPMPADSFVTILAK